MNVNVYLGTSFDSETSFVAVQLLRPVVFGFNIVRTQDITSFNNLCIIESISNWSQY